MKSNAKRCLVVDDDSAVRRVLAAVLERGGYRVLVASSGKEAIASLERESVPVMLCDIRMPDMDGIALLRQVQLRWPNTGVVMVTSVSEVSVAVSCLQMGALDFVAKPFQMEDVQARIEQALDKRRLILENHRYQTNLEGMVREQSLRLEELFLESVQSLAHALDAKDSYTKGHSARVRAYSRLIATTMGVDSDIVQVIQLGAELHDIGKIGIPDSILLKPAALEKDEYLQLMEHAVIGERILASMLKNAPTALSIVRSHHERLDGKGFPDGLQGDEIPLPVRIVTIADSFDAMTTARPYRNALPKSTAFEELERCAGSQFDPDMVKAFIEGYPDNAECPIRTPERLRLQLPSKVSGISHPG